MKYLMIGVFGLIGVFSRYGLNVLFVRENAGSITPSTFVINLVGSFLIGVVYVLGVEKSVISSELRVALMVGLLGGFTTFSSYSLEAASFIKNNQGGLALIYVLASTVGGILLTFGGISLTRVLTK